MKNHISFIDKKTTPHTISIFLAIFFGIFGISSCNHTETNEPTVSWHLSPTISDKENTLAIAIPYASGDTTGDLTAAVISSVQKLPNVQIEDDAPYLLSITILDDKESKIGYRYDPLKKDKKIIPNENRSSVLISVSLLDRGTKKTIWGPGYILGSINYDHQNSSINNNTLAYSLGQLADLDTAQDVTYIPLYRDLSNKIALWLQTERETKTL